MQGRRRGGEEERRSYINDESRHTLIFRAALILFLYRWEKRRKQGVWEV